MKRGIAIGLILTLTCSVTVKADEPLHQSWMKFINGQWTYKWTSQDGEDDEAGNVTIKWAANGRARTTTILTENGDRESELVGWQGDRGVLLVVGFSSNGGYWHLEYSDLQAQTMNGSGYGVLPDGKPWKGKLTVTRKSGNAYEIHCDGTAGGEPFVTVGRHDRVLTPGQQAMQKLAFLIGEWENRKSDGTTERVSSRWINNESYMLTSIGDYTEIAGWDLEEKQIVSWGFGTHGGQGKYYWTQVDDKTWTCEAKPAFLDRHGKPFKSHNIFTIIDNDTLKVELGTGDSRKIIMSHRIEGD
jgi:hypothetical protein